MNLPNFLKRTDKTGRKGLIYQPDDDILGIITQKLSVFEDFQRPNHPVWYMCFLRLHGQHYSGFNPKQWRYVKGKAYTHEKGAPRPKLDLVGKAIDDLVSLLTDGFPVVRVKPAEDDAREEDIIAAEKGDKWIIREQERIDTPETIEDIFVWAMTTGNIFRQAFVLDSLESVPFVENVQRMEEKQIPKLECTECNELSMPGVTQCPICGAMGTLQETIDTVQIPMTDLKRNEDGTPFIAHKTGSQLGSRNVTPFQFFPHPLASNFPTCPEWFIANQSNVDFINNQFKEEIKESHGANEFYQFQKILNAMNPDIYGDSLYFSQGQDTRLAGDAMVFEYYKRPIPGIDPDGAYIVFTKDKILKNGKKPYPYKPGNDGIFHYGWTKTGKFWYAGLVEKGFPVNDEINSIHAQLNSIRKDFADKRRLLFEGSGVSERDYYEGKRCIKVDDKELKPEIEDIKGVPPEIPMQLEYAHQQFEEIMGWNEAIKGIPPKNIRTASGYQMLLERATAPQHKKIINVLAQQKKFWKFQLWQAQNLFDDMQIIKIGEGRLEGNLFRAADIQGYLRIEVDSSQPFPNSRAVKQQRVTEMLQYMGQLFTRDPHTINAFMKMMDLSPDTFDPMFERHRDQARMEVVKMKAGQQIQIDPFDNHEIHLYVHEMAYFSDDVQRNPQVKQMIAMHILLHQQTYQQIQMQNFMAGTPQQDRAVPTGQEQGAPQGNNPQVPGA